MVLFFEDFPYLVCLFCVFCSLQIAQFQLSLRGYTSFDPFRSEPDSEPVKISGTISPPHATLTLHRRVLRPECVESYELPGSWLNHQTCAILADTVIPVLLTLTVGRPYSSQPSLENRVIVKSDPVSKSWRTKERSLRGPRRWRSSR